MQLYGCGVGPLEDENSRDAAARTLNDCADVITLRDEESAEELKNLGVDKPRVLLAADPALAGASAAGEREKAVGFALRSWEGFWSHVPDFGLAARYAWETYRLRPVFLCLAPGDREAARSVCEALEDVPVSVSVDSRRVGRMSLVISMRLHGLVFALRDGVPAAGVSYDPKVSAFCRQAGLPCLSLADAEAEALCRLIDEAAQLDGEELRSSARKLAERERVNGRAAAQLLSDAE